MIDRKRRERGSRLFLQAEMQQGEPLWKYWSFECSFGSIHENGLLFWNGYCTLSSVAITAEP